LVITDAKNDVTKLPFYAKVEINCATYFGWDAVKVNTVSLIPLEKMSKVKVPVVPNV